MQLLEHLILLYSSQILISGLLCVADIIGTDKPKIKTRRKFLICLGYPDWRQRGCEDMWLTWMLGFFPRGHDITHTWVSLLLFKWYHANGQTKYINFNLIYSEIIEVILEE